MIAFVALYNVIHVHQMDMEAKVLWCNLKWEMCLLQIGSTKCVIQKECGVFLHQELRLITRVFHQL
jgi:hypothetical protein